MIPLVSSVLLASLLGSPHCAGMCGGFVAFYAGGDGHARWRPHLAYNGGRLVSYFALGIVAGAIGAGVDHVSALAGLGRVAAAGAGALMVAWGGVALLGELGVRIHPPRTPAVLHRPIGAALRAVRDRSASVRGLVMGLVTTLLPCGWLYAFVTVAGGTAHPASGALVMAVFWLGTLPVMAGLGLAARSTLGPLRRRLPALTAALLVAFGLLTVAGKFRPMPMTHLHAAPGAVPMEPATAPAHHGHH